MKVVVVGATGNVGTSLLQALGRDAAVESVVGLARRAPDLELAKVSWRQADVTHSDLRPHLAGADAVVHLAWLIQPSRDRDATRRVNVEGSHRVFEAVAACDVSTLIYASSVGAYSAGPKDRAVDESWPTEGIPTSFYSRDKAEVERLLDTFERRHPGIRVVRLRPGLIFKREAASEIRRYFAGPLLPSPLVRPGLIPLIPSLSRLRFQAVHADDVAEAYRLAVHGPASGAFNVAAEPVLDPPRLAELLDARPLGARPGVIRAAASASWRLRLQPTPPGWLDMALGVPLMDASRARDELGWSPEHDAEETLLELLDGLRRRSGYPTPPLDPRAGGLLRWREWRSGVGARCG